MPVDRLFILREIRTTYPAVELPGQVRQCYLRPMSSLPVPPPASNANATPARFEPDLARSLNNLSNRLAAAGDLRQCAGVFLSHGRGRRHRGKIGKSGPRRGEIVESRKEQVICADWSACLLKPSAQLSVGSIRRCLEGQDLQRTKHGAAMQAVDCCA